MKKFYCLFIVLVLFYSSLNAQDFTQLGPSDVYYANDLIFGANDRIFLSTSSGLYISDDLGITWEKVKESFNDVYFEPKFTKNNRGDIYVYDARSGINYTTDNGLTWKMQYFVFPSNETRITSLGITEEKLFIGTKNGLLYLQGDAVNGTAISEFNNMEITVISVINNKVIVGTKNNGLYISEDLGVTWTLKTENFPINLEISVLEFSGNKLYMGTKWNGIYYTEDWGTTWSQKNSGLQSNYIQDLHIDGVSIYAITDSYNNIYSSTISGNSWTLIDNGIDNHYSPIAITAKGNNLIFGAWHGILKSTNGGNSWSVANEGIKDISIKSLQLSNDGTIFAISGNTGIYYKTIEEKNFTVFENSIGGYIGYSDIEENKLPIVWPHAVKLYDISTKDVVDEISTVGIHHLFPDVLIAKNEGYFLSTLVDGVYHLTEANNWETFNTNLSSLVVNDFKAAGDVLFAATDGGLFKSNILESDWTKFDIDNSNSGIQKILIQDDIIIAALKYSSTYISRDKGTTWELIEDLENNHISDIIYHNQKFYACSYGRIHYSNDFGKTWVNTKVPNIYLESLLIVDNKLYIGTTENGILSAELIQKPRILILKIFHYLP